MFVCTPFPKIKFYLSSDVIRDIQGSEAIAAFGTGRSRVARLTLRPLRPAAFVKLGLNAVEKSACHRDSKRCHAARGQRGPAFTGFHVAMLVTAYTHTRS
jgi:hypothetical protein